MMKIEFLDKIDSRHRLYFEERVSIPAETEILNENDQCGQVLFLLSGEIEVYKLSENGKVFRLYTILPGESCVLNMSCILSDTRYMAYARALTDCECIVIPKPAFMEMFNTEESIKAYVFKLISHRLVEITSKVEGIVLKSLEDRLKDFLLQDGHKIVYITHEQLANHLGTAREVVSRHLKVWEKEGKIELSRGKIHIINL